MEVALRGQAFTFRRSSSRSLSPKKVSFSFDVDHAWTTRPQRPDFIKIVPVYSEHGLRVSAHVESARDFAIAVHAATDLIAHMPGFARGTIPLGLDEDGPERGVPVNERASVVNNAG